MDLVASVAWFICEAIFLLIFQGFLKTVGLLSSDLTRLPEWYPSDLKSNLVILVIYGVLRSVLFGLKKYLPTVSNQIFVADKRSEILRASFTSEGNHSTSEIISVFGETINKSGSFILHISNALGSLVIIVLFLAFSLRLAPYETCISLFLLSVLMFPIMLVNKKIRNYGAKLNQDWGKVNKVLVNGLKNIFLIRIYKLAQKESEKGVVQIVKYEENYLKYMKESSIISGLPLTTGLLVIAIITYLSQTYIHTDPFRFVAFLYLFLRIAQNAGTFSVSVSNMFFYYASFKHLVDWVGLHNSAKVIDEETLSRKFRSPLSIEIKNLSYKYDSKDLYVIRHFSVNIKPSSLLLVRGVSGVGKSTLIKLITGVLKPTEGDIFIEGENASDFMRQYSSSLAYVGPEPFLIPGSLRENLLYGNDLIVTDDQLINVLRDMNLSEMFANLKNGLDEDLYEETQLSTGQKQRISFARALLRNPKLLILDEATANIDYQTEKIIMDYLIKIKFETTIIAISHRNSFDDIATVKLDFLGNGKILIN
jgi:ATP-binding cassette subfamily B protein